MTDEGPGFEDYPDSGQNDIGIVSVQEEEGQTVYPEGSDCYACRERSTGVAIVDVPNLTLHEPVCEEHLAELEQEHDDVEFRPYE